MSLDDASAPTEVFLVRSLQKILAEKDLKKSANAELKAACENAIAGLEKDIAKAGGKLANKKITSSTPLAPPGPGNTAATVKVATDRYYVPFRLACQNKSPRVVRTALDCLEKLMAYGHISSTMVTEMEGLPDAQRLVDSLVETVCDCFKNESTDEGVQLQIIKALLTAVTSTVCVVHDRTLIRAFRTCYNIFLTSKNVVNQATAKATLSQMIHVIFQRMESVALPTPQSVGENDDTPHSDGDGDGDGDGEAVLDNAAENGVAQMDGAVPSFDVDAFASGVASRIIAAAVFELTPESPSDALDDEPALLQDQQYGHVYRKDAFVVFRSMCKLSMPPLSEEDASPRSHQLKSKLLSLELQLAILQNAGPGFLSDDLFIDGIKKYLCVALSKNGVSHVPAVFELSVAIFYLLLTKFKEHVKMQIEVFFKEILFTVLGTSLSSFQHKWIVMGVLNKITKNPQMVVDLYLNYDCDEYLHNIFEQMVREISRVAQGRASSELGATPQQQHQIQEKGLESLAAIMEAMDSWTRSMIDDVNSSAAKDVISIISESDADDAEKKLQTEIEQFKMKKEKKKVLQKGIELFNQKPKKGLKLLQETGFVGPTAIDAAHFLHDESRLDPVAVGEYIGESDKYNIEVMHAYVDTSDFGDGTDFVTCLRTFLSNFRIPGESQKIDRIMEKFAARYIDLFKENGIFANADAAYVLSYSIMMLTTSLHNDNVKKKISKEDFIKMTRGINDSKDLPRAFVEGIYDNIALQELALKKAAPMARPAAQQLNNPREREALYNEQRKTLERSAEEAMKSAGHGKASTLFLTATHAEHVAAMFEVVWASLMSAFSVPLESSSDPHVVSLCLKGLRLCIHVACIFEMDFQREAFVPCLAKFTKLSSPSEIQHKNVEAIRALLQVAVREGNFLKSSWNEVLACVSALELAQVETSEGKKHSSHHRTGAVNETSSQDIIVATDRIFTMSRNLNGVAVVDFVAALCRMSMQELSAHPPRKYSLTKTIEIAYYNMERVRMEWARIWQIMGEHFNRAGCIANQHLAFFAVDSLRQLSIKFLEKGELANYSFQKDFLRPFEYIMQHNKNTDIRDMVVRCVEHLVKSKADNIRSGWKNIFFVFSLAAGDTNENIVRMAFDTTSFIFDKYFSKANDYRASLIAASFTDAVNCLSEFACNAHYPKLSMRAITQLRLCASTVADVPELFHDPSDDMKGDPELVKGWFPVIFGLSRIITRSGLDVRTRALSVMFEIMKEYGSRFEPKWWTDLFSVVFRIFDTKKLRGMASAQDRTEWMTTTCTHALRSIVDVVTQFFPKLESTVLGDLFNLITWCVHRENEHLARTGTECLHILVMSNGINFSQGTWDLAVETLSSLFESTQPVELYQFSAPPEDGEDGEDGENDEAHSQKQQEAPEVANATVQQSAAVVASSTNADTSTQPSSDAASLPDAKRVAHPADSSTDADGTATVLQDSQGSTEEGGKGSGQEDSSKASATAHPKAASSSPQKKKKKAKDERTEEKNRHNRLFHAIVIKSVIQLALIQTVEWIVLTSTKPESQLTAPKRTLVGSESDTTNAHQTHTSALSKPRLDAEKKALEHPLDEAGEMFGRLGTARLMQLLHCLLASHEFARNFNANIDLRTKLWKAGFMKHRSKPNLLKQETTALSCALRILFRIYENGSEDQGDVDAVEERTKTLCSSTIDHFLSDVAADTRTIWAPLICLIIRELLALPEARFTIHAAHHYASLAECITLGFDSNLGDIAFLLAAFFQRCKKFSL